MNKTLKAHLALLVAALIYGANYSIAKIVMPYYLKPFIFVLFRVVVAAVLFWLSSIFIPKQKLESRDFRKLLICAIFGIATNQLLFFVGLSKTSPIHASIMMLCSPIIVVVISAYINKEYFTKRQTFGMFLSFLAAVWLVASNHSINQVESSAIGDILILINAISWSVYLVLVQDIMRKYHTVTVMKWLFLMGSFFVFPFGYIYISSTIWHTFSLNIWFAIAYVAVFTTYLAYLMNNYALKVLSSGVVSNYIYLQPLLATSIALLLGRDSLDFHKVGCGICIIYGVFLVSRK